MYKKETAMVVMRTPKRASSFLRPADSRKRKVKVSTPVISTPTHSGILKVQTMQPRQRCKYTTSADIQKLKKLVTHVKSHVSAVSLLESGE